jgi:hypothetical protein
MAQAMAQTQMDGIRLKGFDNTLVVMYLKNFLVGTPPAPLEHNNKIIIEVLTFSLI